MVPLLAVGAGDPVLAVNIVGLRVDLETVVAILVLLKVLTALCAKFDRIVSRQPDCLRFKSYWRLAETSFVHRGTKLVETLELGVNWLRVLTRLRWLGVGIKGVGAHHLLTLDVGEQIRAKI